MEIKDDEFQTLRLKVDQISSELEKQHAIRAVNTKWLVIVGSVILAALGFTNFHTLPNEAKNAARAQIGDEIRMEAETNLSLIEKHLDDAETYLSQIKEAFLTGVVTTGETIEVPDGTGLENWELILIPIEIGAKETDNWGDNHNFDNAVVHYSISYTEQANKGWKVDAKQAYNLKINKGQYFRHDQSMKVKYILLPKRPPNAPAGND